jgi:phosphatidylinositol alpha-mannosyltransferase
MSATSVELPPGAEWVEADTTAELARAYASAWVTVLPAVHEAFGLVLVESLAAGTPVVAARSGAVPEIVTSKGIGALFEPDDVQALRAALEEGLEIARRRGVSGRCRKRAQDFDWNALAERWEEIYSGALPASRAGTAAISDPAS